MSRKSSGELISYIRFALADFSKGKKPDPHLTKSLITQWELHSEAERLQCLSEASEHEIDDIIFSDPDNIDCDPNFGSGGTPSAAHVFKVLAKCMLPDDEVAVNGYAKANAWIGEKLCVSEASAMTDNALKCPFAEFSDPRPYELAVHVAPVEEDPLDPTFPYIKLVEMTLENIKAGQIPEDETLELIGVLQEMLSPLQRLECALKAGAVANDKVKDIEEIIQSLTNLGDDAPEQDVYNVLCAKPEVLKYLDCHRELCLKATDLRAHAEDQIEGAEKRFGSLTLNALN